MSNFVKACGIFIGCKIMFTYGVIKYKKFWEELFPYAP
jgi:hypothetical protein